MRTAKIQSISLSPELQSQVEEIQKEKGMTRSELYRAALRRFVQGERRWRKLQEYGEKQARKAGLRTEEQVLKYAVRAVRAYRRKHA